MNNIYYVYILTSQRNGTLYTGVTSNLEKRLQEHKSKTFKGFTENYNINILVYYEYTNSVEQAIDREKQLKKWNREWKIELIEKSNPEWRDLSMRINTDLDPRLREDDNTTKSE